MWGDDAGAPVIHASAHQKASWAAWVADASFRNTGLERSKALAADLAWFKQTHGLDAPVLAEDGPGARLWHAVVRCRVLVRPALAAPADQGLLPHRTAPAWCAGRSYAAKVLRLAKSDPPAFICHFYNFYFAHTAGGRMIGNKVRSTGLLPAGARHRSVLCARQSAWSAVELTRCPRHCHAAGGPAAGRVQPQVLPVGGRRQRTPGRGACAHAPRPGQQFALLRPPRDTLHCC